jgi:hypothetical protein
MQTWEYAWIEVDGYNVRGHVNVETIFGKLQAQLQSLGKQGWEIAGIAGGEPKETHRIYFKRPIP